MHPDFYKLDKFLEDGHINRWVELYAEVLQRHGSEFCRDWLMAVGISGTYEERYLVGKRIIQVMRAKAGISESVDTSQQIKLGDHVEIIDGTFKGQLGIVEGYYLSGNREVKVRLENLTIYKLITQLKVLNQEV